MADLSEHFSRSEFACRCGCGFDDAHPKLVRGLEEARAALSAHLGRDAPLKITSGCRCPKYNRRVGGRPNSMHLAGYAGDLWTPAAGVLVLRRFLEGVAVFGEGGLHAYSSRGFVHCDVGRQRRW